VLPALADAGLNWSRGQLRHLEKGQTSPTMPTLYALAGAFGAFLGRPLRIADLLEGDQPVRIGNRTVGLPEIRAALTGGEVEPARGPNYSELMQNMLQSQAEFFADVETWPDRIQLGRQGPWHNAYRTCMDADHRIARRLAVLCGVTPSRVIAEMGYLWNHSLTVERDRIAHPDASAQKRGRITRTLAADLERSINRGDDS
jgi:transcriptional regulator with XRE-family HTH domain